MIFIKNPEQIKKMMHAGRITGEALSLAGEAVRPGITTAALDKIIRTHIEKSGAKPSFLGYGGFPGSACISINDEVIHGIPSKNRILREGDIVSIDTGATYKGYTSDAARTYAVGEISAEAQRLIDVTKESFFRGVKYAVAGNRLHDIGHAIQEYAEPLGMGIIRDYTGHGVGRNLHEDPMIPNYGVAGTGVKLKAGMTLAIEPMLTLGTYKCEVLSNDWTVVTLDGSLAAHYENTVVVTDGEPEILTL